MADASNPSATEHTCPHCGRGSLVRCGRHGVWEKHVLPLFGVYPWRCGRCRSRFRLSDRGTTFKRVTPAQDYFGEAATAAHPSVAHSAAPPVSPSTQADSLDR